MHFKNEFAAHRKIDFFDFASIESYGSQTNMIDFGIIKITIIKDTVDKGNIHKITGRERTIVKCAALKFFEIDFINIISVAVVF
jgi:hypothetical protein